MDVSAIPVVVAIVLLASAAVGLTGFGFALTVVPVFLLVLDVKDTVVLASLLAIANLLLLAVRVWRQVPWRTVIPLLVGSFVGMPLGLAVLLLAPEDALRIGVAVAVIVMALAIARGLRIRSQGAAGEIAVGVSSGILSTSTSLPGPPVVLYLQGRGLPPERFRAALTMFFLIGTIASLGAFVGADVVSANAWLLAATALPAVVVGNLSGDRLLRFVDPRLFSRLVVLLLIATALSAVGSSIHRLAG